MKIKTLAQFKAAISAPVPEGFTGPWVKIEYNRRDEFGKLYGTHFTGYVKSVADKTVKYMSPKGVILRLPWPVWGKTRVHNGSDGFASIATDKDGKLYYSLEFIERPKTKFVKKIIKRLDTEDENKVLSPAEVFDIIKACAENLGRDDMESMIAKAVLYSDYDTPNDAVTDAVIKLSLLNADKYNNIDEERERLAEVIGIGYEPDFEQVAKALDDMSGNDIEIITSDDDNKARLVAAALFGAVNLKTVSQAEDIIEQYKNRNHA